MPDATTGWSEPHAPGGRSGGRRGVARDAGLRVGEEPDLPRRRELAFALADHQFQHPSRHGCDSRCIRPTAAAVTAVATRVLKLMVSQGECQLATPGKIRLFTDSKASIPSNTTPAATSTAWGMWLTPTGCSVGHGKSLSSTADRHSPGGTVVAAGDVRQEVRPDRRGRPPAGPVGDYLPAAAPTVRPPGSTWRRKHRRRQR